MCGVILDTACAATQTEDSEAFDVLSFVTTLEMIYHNVTRWGVSALLAPAVWQRQKHHVLT